MEWNGAGVFLRGDRDRAVGRPDDLQDEVAVHPNAGHDQLGDELRALLRDAPCGLAVLLPAHQHRPRDEEPSPGALVPGHAVLGESARYTYTTPTLLYKPPTVHTPSVSGGSKTMHESESEICGVGSRSANRSRVACSSLLNSPSIK